MTEDISVEPGTLNEAPPGPARPRLPPAAASLCVTGRRASIHGYTASRRAIYSSVIYHSRWSRITDVC